MSTERAALAICAWWAVLFTVIAGMGSLYRRAFGLHTRTIEQWLLSFWIGWAALIALLQLWHLRFPVDSKALAIVGLMGTGGLIMNFRDLRRAGVANLRQRRWLYAILALTAVWLSHLSLGPISNFDTGLYHMQTVKWVTSFPVVPGLGNLHDRLAFNSSYHLYAGLLESGPWSFRGHELANGLLLLALFAQLWFAVHRLVASASRARPHHMFLALLLGPCLLRPGSDLYRGLSPDLAVFIINIVMSSLFLKWLDEPRSSREASFELSALVVFASVGITLKLSLTSAAAAVVLLAFVLHARTPTSPSRSRARQAAAALIASGILIVPWLARGGILSGYPAYPAEWPSLPVAWKVPKVLVHSMTNWIRSRARQPESHWSQVPDNWDWLAGWWSRLPPEFTKAALLTAGSVFLSLGVLSRPIRGPERNLPEQWLFLIPQLILLASWAALAPDPRFTAGSIWILPAGLLALTWARVAARRGTLSSRIVGGGLCVLLPLFALAPYGTVLIRSPRPTVAATVPLAQTELHETASGLRVHIPIGSNQCWDSPLPCTPYFRRNLSQRKGGDLGSGFYLSAAATCADIHSCEPPGFTTPPTIGVAVVFEDWYPFEEATKLVWMKATGRFLLYVEKPVNVTLSLVPAVIHEQGDFGQQGRLAIRLDGRLLGRFDIAAEQKLEVPLSLRADFNQVTLELEAGSFVPSEHIPDYPDMREFGIAFHEFVLTEERDSGTLPTP